MRGFAQGVYIAALVVRGMLVNIMQNKISDGEVQNRTLAFGEGFQFL